MLVQELTHRAFCTLDAIGQHQPAAQRVGRVQQIAANLFALAYKIPLSFPGVLHSVFIHSAVRDNIRNTSIHMDYGTGLRALHLLLPLPSASDSDPRCFH